MLLRLEFKNFGGSLYTESLTDRKRLCIIKIRENKLTKTIGLPTVGSSCSTLFVVCFGVLFDESKVVLGCLLCVLFLFCDERRNDS